MSEAQSYAHAFEAYNSNEFAKQQSSFDFFSFHSPSDVAAPHPDLFESDIDSNLAAFPDLQLLTVDSYDPYFFRPSEKPQWQGPLSSITVSSDTQDSLSSYSLSVYNDHSQPVSTSQVFPFDLDMSFQQARIGSDYDAVPPSMAVMEDDPASFGTLPPTPPQSPPRGSTTSSDYYSHSSYSPSLPTVSPIHISTQLPAVATVTPQPVEEYEGDPRKKYKCSACPRAFARAYNLKTHMATHDPNRLKPHVCPQRSCGRSFSRKHDLGRHLISIHRDEAVGASLLPASKKAIGVENGNRGWCDSCGKGWVGRTNECDCHDVK
ncbi:hypothetical protein CPB84DRAFT_1814085 [Gymnopilus junonius]|uniref:C2H2-type domain-containing protein n=1 Tax=Gymnopilus junonius TaxID=109634 RepID=A0A9P5TQR5_GYMJU|nr:hypothetical protein CPB84DRAFT_1814085 [Gymnopilus junonius]